MYTFTKSPLSGLSYLTKLQSLLTSNEIEIFHEMGELDRMSLDGMITLIGNINGQRVGVIFTDFKVLGGSFSKRNSLRVCKFISLMKEMKLPIVFSLNSLGVRFVEGRTVFDNAFSVINYLYQFKKENLLITVGLGKVLGIAALIFAQGHYRIALEDETKINLTGPEVHKRFFGHIDTPFDKFTNSTHQHAVNTIIHELHATQEKAYQSAKNLIDFSFNESAENQNVPHFSEELETGAMVLRSKEADHLSALEKEMGDSLLELFSQKGIVVRIYIGKIEGKKVGYIINPPFHPNNMLTVNAVDKSIAALELFNVLGIPVVNIMDSPGGDPRKAESDKDAIMKMITLAHAMIDYPHPKMGILLGRCYGGAAMFSFPEIFGGLKTFAVEGAKIGVIHKEIIDELLSNSSRVKEMWDVVAATETPDMQDMIDCGTFDSVITFNQIREKIVETILAENNELHELEQENFENYTINS